MSASVKRSPWLLHYDGTSCNGCDIEVLAALTPVYDAERFGIVNTGDPMQADIFLITGGVNSQNAAVVKQLYDQMPRPKVVVAVGVCACTGGVFKDCYNIHGGADTVIPVDIYVPGCSAKPQNIIDGIVKAIDLFQRRADVHTKLFKEGRANNLMEIARAEAAVKATIETIDPATGMKPTHQHKPVVNIQGINPDLLDKDDKEGEKNESGD